MTFMHRWMMTALVLAACGEQPPSKRPSDSNSSATTIASGPAIRWGVSQGLWGTETFEVGQDGRGHYRFQPVGPGETKDYEVQVSAAQLDAIGKEAEASSFCDEKSSRLGIPDEGKPSLSIQRGSVHCEVTLWDGEWSERPGPKKVSGMVFALRKGKD